MTRDSIIEYCSTFCICSCKAFVVTIWIQVTYYYIQYWKLNRCTGYDVWSYVPILVLWSPNTKFSKKTMFFFHIRKHRHCHAVSIFDTRLDFCLIFILSNLKYFPTYCFHKQINSTKKIRKYYISYLHILTVHSLYL